MAKAQTTVSKGKIVKLADQLLSSPTQELLDGIKNAAQLTDRGVAVGVLSEADKSHVDSDWFGTSWWPDYPDKEAVVKDAYIKALERSLANGQIGELKPVVSYWIYGPEHFEAVVAESDRQISVFLITPTPKNVSLPPAAQVSIEDVWVIAKEDRIAEIQKSFPSDYNMDQLVENGHTARIKRIRLKGY